jgi:predicted metalloprotease with PDZ domain
VDGRDPLPYQESFARAGMRFETDTIVEPYFGVSVARRDSEAVVALVDPGSSADRAGIHPGDVLLRVGDVHVSEPDWDDQFRQAYADSVGAPVAVVYRRNGTERSTRATIGTRTRYEHRLGPDGNAGEAARRVRAGLLTGKTEAG